MTTTPTVTDGFDILISKGTSYVFDPSPDETDDDGFGEEEPTGPSWSSVQLDIDGGIVELNGYNYRMRYWALEEDLQGGDPTKNFLGWKIISQTIEKSSPDRQVFTTDDGDELYPAQPQEVAAGASSDAGGITNDVNYDYLRVFDQAEISYLPRCATINTPFVENSYLPSMDVDPDLPEPKYPMDALSAFVPDDRESVTITYTVTTVYQPKLTLVGGGYGPQQTFTFNITQTCTQEINNLKEKVKAALNKCYFTNKLRHIQLYDNEAPANYDSEGNQIGEVIEPIYEVDVEASNSVGRVIYKLVNSVWSGKDDTDEDEIRKEVKRQRQRSKEMMRGMDELVQKAQEGYLAEFERIEKVEEEEKETIKVNKDRRSKLLKNLSKQMGVSYKELFMAVGEDPKEWTPERVSDVKKEKKKKKPEPTPEPSPEPTPEVEVPVGDDGLGELTLSSSSIAVINGRPTMAKGLPDIFDIDPRPGDIDTVDWYVYDIEDEKLLDIGSKVLIDRKNQFPTKITILPVGVYTIYGWCNNKKGERIYSLSGFDVDVLPRDEVPEKQPGWDTDYENEVDTPPHSPEGDGLGELTLSSPSIAVIDGQPTMAKGQSDIFVIDKTGSSDFRKIDWYVYDLQDEKLIDIGTKVLIDRPNESPTKITIFPIGLYLIYGYAYAKGDDVSYRIPGYEVEVLDRDDVPEKQPGWDEDYENEE